MAKLQANCQSILVAPNALPDFWIFMYHISPLRYFLEGLAIAGISGMKVSCSDIELLEIPLPPGQGTCGEYLAAHLQQTTGMIMNPEATSDHCEYCPVSEANLVLESLGMEPEKARAWRNLGLLAVYVVVDIIALFAIYYLSRVPWKLRKT